MTTVVSNCSVNCERERFGLTEIKSDGLTELVSGADR